MIAEIRFTYDRKYFNLLEWDQVVALHYKLIESDHIITIEITKVKINASSIINPEKKHCKETIHTYI